LSPLRPCCGTLARSTLGPPQASPTSSGGDTGGWIRLKRTGRDALPWAAILLSFLLLSCGSNDTAPERAEAPSTGPSPSAPWFVDVTEEVGLDFVHETGAVGGIHLPEIMAGGAALFDFDSDGDLDAYLTNGNFDLAGGEPGSRPVNRLFRQEADGSFVDVTAGSGQGDPGYGLGMAVGDYDNDGNVDLYASNFGADRLYRNLGDGTFEDVTAGAGIRVGGFSCSAIFCDYDNDGYLDLFVTQYVRYNPSQICKSSAGERDYCSPRAFNPAPDVLLHNNGDGTFADVSRRAGLHGTISAGLGVGCEDFDRDGFPDFYVANDQYANNLWFNRGDGTFEDRALMMGAAYNMEGREEAGMGVIVNDLDNDLVTDLFVTHLGGQSNTLYRGLGGGLFEDATGAVGLAQSSLPFTGFGTVALDLELDGDLDILIADGRAFRGPEDPASIVKGMWSYFSEPNLLYLQQNGRFELHRELAVPLTEPVEVSRALVAGDIDDDGDQDVLVANIQSRARLYRNEAPREGDWLTVRAVDPRLNRIAIGARLTLVAGPRTQVRTVSRGSGYLSSNDPRAHFGLGRDSNVERIDVRWPDGLEESFPVPGLDRVITLERGSGETGR